MSRPAPTAPASPMADDCAAMIPLRNRDGDVIASATVDADDHEWLSRWRWCLKDNGYAIRGSRHADGRFRCVFMHREILGAPPGALVDHRDGNKLNNCRGNIRLCTKGQNGANQPARSTNTHRLKGVARSRHHWRAQIQHGGKMYHLGVFDSVEAAHAAYLAAAIRLHGEFAHG